MKPVHNSPHVENANSIRTAGLLSIIPGLGQLYNKQKVKESVSLCLLAPLVLSSMTF